MADLPRILPHIVLRSKGSAEGYTTNKKPPRHKLPDRDRAQHADALKAALEIALVDAELRRGERTEGTASGFYLEVEFAPGSEQAAELLESRAKGIELVAMRSGSAEAPARATIFVPDKAAGFLRKKIDEYKSEETKPRKPDGVPQPKHQPLIARLQSIALAAIRSVYTDDPNLLPLPGQKIWWEVWIRPGVVDSFEATALKFDVLLQKNALAFPDREVRLAFGDEVAMARLFVNTDAIAELRRAKDTPSVFMRWTNREQAEWTRDITDRLAVGGGNDVAVCLLDTGVTRRHPLISPLMSEHSAITYDPTWSEGDAHGHGTNMAGLALYGDLVPIMLGTGAFSIFHRLESVKILPDHGENDPRLYGAITLDSVAGAEIAAPDRRRAVCMAVTSDVGTTRGRPSSWSAAVDKLCFGDATIRRLLLISAGNIRENLSHREYPSRNDVEPIENPGQAWNAITVGAYTEKSIIGDQSYAGWTAVAPSGDLCPTSRTSVSWERPWPVKPDIVLEGGNWATDGDQIDCPDDLGILTTHRDPSTRHFDIIRDTSAATALAANLAGRMMVALPERWPESIRGLIIHSAEWTPSMRQKFAAFTTEQQKLVFLRTFGYGVPAYERAVLSAANDLTLIAEDEIQPFEKKASQIKTHQMNLHRLPWPIAALEELGHAEVELRVTLSYYVEPNPGERGWIRKHRYPSHSFRFDLKRAFESEKEFRQRINKQAIGEEETMSKNNSGSDGWLLGRIRDRGSIHSDHWKGMAIDLAKRSVIAVYPVGGWWKENPRHDRYGHKVRYSLIVSIRALSSEVDIYTPVVNQVAASIEIST